MAISCRAAALLRPGLWAALLLIPAVLTAADRRPRKPLPQGELVEIFSGMENGQIEVKLIARDSARANLLVRNKTDKPLNVVLPPAFAGVPVLAQFPNNLIGLDPRPGNNRLGNNARVPQRLGVVPGRNNLQGPMMNLPGRNLGNPNMPPGFFFNVAPEKVGKLKLTTVCLEYGKPNPGPRFKYQVKPLAAATKKAEVIELCGMLGRGEIDQRAAQLAAWHLNNDISWQELASLREKLTLGTKPTYTQRELQAGKQAAGAATKLAEKQRRSDTEKTTSLSRD